MISLIVAMDQNGAIGLNNAMPWHIPNDLKWFKKNTLNKTIVMGKQTWLSIGSKPLTQRKNIVLSRNKNLKIVGAELIYDYKKVLEMKTDEICIIGGAQIYQLYLPWVEKIYLTRIWHQFEADTFLNLNLDDYQLNFEQHNQATQKEKYAYSFQIYLRK